ncbi:sensor histidine kinase [Streptomyces sp. NPDC012600]|uniref:sensor histidine kinase n=1 Tax=unclassified Streptomyces TaxID=2593676 RepID=UPI0036746ADC
MSESGARHPLPRSLLPGELAAAAGRTGPPEAGRVRRTPRDWAVDCLAFGWALLCGAVLLRVVADYDHLPLWIRALDVPLGALACLALWWRRSYPVTVALIGIPAMSFANTSVGAATVILLNLGLRVPWQRALPVVALCIVTVAPYVLVYSVPHEGGWAVASFILAYYLAFFSWGSALRARRLLVLKLREDADRERAEHARRLADSRRAERAAIAREMHDVLAHRISLLSVHAGALVYRTKQTDAGRAPALSGAEIVESAQVIRDNAHQALEELHDMLRVLRSDERHEPGPGDRRGATADSTAAPQPRMADIAHLVEEARAAGQQIDLRAEGRAATCVRDEAPDSTCVRDEAPDPDDVRDDPSGPAGPPRPAPRSQVQRTAYRLVQEGLTNARKHAPGARVTVRVAGAPGAGLTVEVRSPLPVGVTASEIPGAGAGLTGLRERVELDGGSLEHGSREGAFVLRARLPWP